MNAPEPDTIRIFIPLQIKQPGRPRIVPPEHIERTQARQQPHVLRAIARAWAWRRKLERGEAATLADIARAQGVDTSFVSRFMRLACNPLRRLDLFGLIKSGLVNAVRDRDGNLRQCAPPCCLHSQQARGKLAKPFERKRNFAAHHAAFWPRNAKLAEGVLLRTNSLQSIS